MQGNDIAIENIGHEAAYPSRVREIPLVVVAQTAADDDGKEYYANWDCNFRVSAGSTTQMDAHINKASD